ncbi:hypothetical protein GCM10010195_39120 [Kitasatospora griseola]|nr:hypothetical protein GCM10010195_39120 [Kitasatospora griseola]
MVAAVPIGSRSTAAANSRVMPADATPSSPAIARSRGLRPRSRGRVKASRTTAAKEIRRKVAPATPSTPNSGLEAATPSCTATIETTHSTGAGMPPSRRRIPLARARPEPPSTLEMEVIAGSSVVLSTVREVPGMRSSVA